MVDGMEPTEEYDGSITVRLFKDDGERVSKSCESYEAAIELVKEARTDYTVVEIVAKDDTVVFNTVDMNIEDWAVEWKNTKRRLSVDIEPRDCPHDNVACFADDLCVDCQIDKVQNNY